mgnify:CR=1 FL=1
MPNGTTTTRRRQVQLRSKLSALVRMATTNTTAESIANQYRVHHTTVRNWRTSPLVMKALKKHNPQAHELISRDVLTKRGKFTPNSKKNGRLAISDNGIVQPLITPVVKTAPKMQKSRTISFSEATITTPSGQILTLPLEDLRAISDFFNRVVVNTINV